MLFVVQMLEELVRRGDDVLNLGAGPRLQQGQGVDQHRLVGNQLGSLLQFSQRRPRRDALLEHRPRFEFRARWQGRQGVVRLVSPPWRGVHVHFSGFFRHNLISGQFMSMASTRQTFMSIFVYLIDIFF
jgi:hypothetical protein